MNYTEEQRKEIEKTMTDKDLVQMIIDCSELIYGKDSERYELNKNKWMDMYCRKSKSIFF